MIDRDVATGLGMLEVDGAEKLDRHDRQFLQTIAGKFGGGPVGLSTLAVAIGEEADTIEDVFEPYLLQQGLVKRTPRGRVLTERAMNTWVFPSRRGWRASLAWLRFSRLASLGRECLTSSARTAGTGN